MAIATVVRNVDDTYTVTVSPRGQDVLKRWGDETGRSRANQLEDAIQRVLRHKLQDYLLADGPTLAGKYAAMSAAQKAIVDPVFAAVTAEPE